MAFRPGGFSTCLRDSWDLAGTIPASSVRGNLPAGINVGLDASSLPGWHAGKTQNLFYCMCSLKEWY